MSTPRKHWVYKGVEGNFHVYLHATKGYRKIRMETPEQLAKAMKVVEQAVAEDKAQTPITFSVLDDVTTVAETNSGFVIPTLLNNVIFKRLNNQPLTQEEQEYSDLLTAAHELEMAELETDSEVIGSSGQVGHVGMSAMRVAE